MTYNKARETLERLAFAGIAAGDGIMSEVFNTIEAEHTRLVGKLQAIVDLCDDDDMSQVERLAAVREIASS